MAIRTGIGVGGAQIFDTSGIIDTYGRQVAQQQKAQALQAEKQAKEQAKFDEDLATAMAGIKTDGVDPKTAEYIQNEYLKIRGLRAEAEKQNPSQRPLFLQGIKDKMNGLKEFSANAKDFNNKLFSMGGKINDWDYDETTLGRYKKLSETPYYQLTPEEKSLNPTMFQKRPNFGLIDKIFTETYNDGKRLSKYKEEVKLPKDGKRFDLNVVDPNVISNIITQRVESNPEAMAAAKQLYVRSTGDAQPTPQKIKDFLNKDYLARFGYEYSGEIKDKKEPKGGGRGDDEDESYNYPIELNLPFAQTSKKPGVVNVKDYTKLPMSKQNFAGSGYIDLSTGKPADNVLDSSNDYEVVGVGNFPIITAGNMKGSLAQPGYAEKNKNSVKKTPMVHVQKITDGIKEDLLIPYDRLPRSKKVNKGLANFTPATSGSSGASTPAPKDNSKVLQGTKSQLKDAASKKGLSIDEYKKQLKLAGYTVIEK
jgi:hypothetical protein